MKDVTKQTGSLHPKELEAVYAISRSVAGAIDTETALDEIIQYLRPVFIFDNIVLYLTNESGVLEPAYARAIGRGRVHEADLAWGEITAQKTFQSLKIVTRSEDTDDTGPERSNSRFTLGLPLIVSDRTLGALVFIRFGGPSFLPGQILLAEFVALHVAQLFQHKQLVEKIASLEAKRRLDSLQSDFIATVTHELLTPLGFIKGYATTLLREDITWDEQTRREFLTIIDEEADRLRELIDELMDSSRLQTGTLPMTFQRLRLDTLLKDLALRTRSRFPQLQLELAIETPGMQISGDPTRLTQVFENIINNAVKYAPGSPLDIILDHFHGRARIRFRDYGPGIPQNELGKIFQRFYRLPQHSAAVRGTGLGLFICRQIVQTHKGEIEAFSQEGHGTTFSILLPLDRPGDHSGTTETI